MATMSKTSLSDYTISVNCVQLHLYIWREGEGKKYSRLSIFYLVVDCPLALLVFRIDTCGPISPALVS